MSEAVVVDIGGAFSEAAKIYGIDNLTIKTSRDVNGITITLFGSAKRYSVKQMVFENVCKIVANCKCAVTIFNDIQVVAQ